MTDRAMSDGAATALAGNTIIPVILGEFEFSSGTVRLWTGSAIGAIEWRGETWHGCGALAGFGAIEETAESRAVGVELTLTGIPLVSIVDGVEIDVLAIANDEDWQQRPARLYFGLLNADLTWKAEPFQIRKGLMDVMELAESKTATIRLTLESSSYDLERAEVLRFTPETQRALYPGDAGCDQIAALQDKVVQWNLN